MYEHRPCDIPISFPRCNNYDSIISDTHQCIICVSESALNIYSYGNQMALHLPVWVSCCSLAPDWLMCLCSPLVPQWKLCKGGELSVCLRCLSCFDTKNKPYPYVQSRVTIKALHAASGAWLQSAACRPVYSMQATLRAACSEDAACPMRPFPIKSDWNMKASISQMSLQWYKKNKHVLIKEGMITRSALVLAWRVDLLH